VSESKHRTDLLKIKGGDHASEWTPAAREALKQRVLHDLKLAGIPASHRLMLPYTSLSPLLTPTHPYSPILAPTHPYLPLLTPTHPYSPLLTPTHPYSLLVIHDPLTAVNLHPSSEAQP
jgi:hypothetical protein